VARIGTRDLEQIIYDHGQGLVSRRKASRFLKAVLDAWRKALRRGEVVDVPGGEVRAVFQDDPSPQRLALLRQGTQAKYVLRRRVGRRRVITFRSTIEFEQLPEAQLPQELWEAREAADLLRYEVWVSDEAGREMERRYGSGLKAQLNQIITNHIPPGLRAGMSRDQQFARAEQLLRDSLKEEVRWLKPFAEWLASEPRSSS
jgi:hypothetical protein